MLNAAARDADQKHERAQRRKVLVLAQARKVDAILVTELNSWGRSVLNVL
jgi:hypothetical protein